MIYVFKSFQMAQSPSPKKKAATFVEKENSSVAASSSDVTMEDETSRDVTSSTDTTLSNLEAATTSNDGPRVLLRKIDTNLFGRDVVTNSVERKNKYSPLSTRGLVALTTSPIIDKKDRLNRPKLKKVNKRLYTDDDVVEQL
jgi:hypothetical protein